MAEAQNKTKPRQEDSATSKQRDLMAGAAAASATVIGIILVAVLQRGVGITDGATTVALLLVPLLVYGMVSGRLTELTGPFGWGAKFAKVESELKQTKEDVEAIRTALRGILTKHEWGPLKALSGTGDVILPRDMPNLINYLHRLDALEYIQPHNKKGLAEIEELPFEQRFNLKDHYHVTDAGRKFVYITEYLEIFNPGANWDDPHPYNDTPRTWA